MTHGGVNNEERSGNFDKEGTLAKEESAHSHESGMYDRAMADAPDMNTGKYVPMKMKIPRGKGKKA